MFIKKHLKSVLLFAGFPFFLLTGLLIAGLARIRSHGNTKPRLVWGSTPLINNRHWSRAMQSAGYFSETYTQSFYSSINQRSDWDRVLDEEWGRCPKVLKPFLAFLHSLLVYDVFFISVDGFFIGRLPFVWRLQAPLLQLAKKKVVIQPYGSDAYVYRRIRSIPLVHGLLLSYPDAARQQSEVQKRLDYWCRNADVCIPGVMGIDGFGRWDVLVPSALTLDLTEWQASSRHSQADGRNATVVVCHAPNHRGFKGTEFLLDAVRKLQAEGLQVELRLLEKIQNSEVRRILREDADILVEQLICTGHGLNAVEGMASGLPVISNLEDEDYILPMRRWSFFSECPIVSATPENLVDVLRKLITRPQLRRELGHASRKYVEKYQGLDSAAYLFDAVIEFAYGRRPSLNNLFHPLKGERTHRLPRIQHSLVNNRIVD